MDTDKSASGVIATTQLESLNMLIEIFQTSSLIVVSQGETDLEEDRGEGPIFQGFVLSINGTSVRNSSTGKLQPISTSARGNKLKQVKCQKTTDTIRHKGNKIDDYIDFKFVNIKWTSDRNDCVKNEELGVDIKFQLFVAPKLPDQDMLNDPESRNVWYYTEITCADMAQETYYQHILDDFEATSTTEMVSTSDNINYETLTTSTETTTSVTSTFSTQSTVNNISKSKLSAVDNYDLSDLPQVQLKFAGFGRFGDVQQKANLFRKPLEKQEKGSSAYESALQAAQVLADPDDMKHVKLTSYVEVDIPSWDEWSKWSECSKSCGYGDMTRTRECISSKTNLPIDDKKCHGLESLGSSHTTKCIKKRCPTWADWQPWTSCSQTCGREATKTRRRSCLYGNTCEGSNMETVSCGLDECPIIKIQKNNLKNHLSTEKFEGKCKDKYSFCNHWSKKGYCEQRFTKWMSSNCPVVCGKCQKEEPKKPDCVDRYQISCPKWQAQNRCNHPDKFLREYIVKNCQLSCGIC